MTIVGKPYQRCSVSYLDGMAAANIEANTRIAELEMQLEKAEKVIRFYGSEDTWIDKEIVNGSLFAWGKKHPIHDVSIVPYSIGESNGNFHCLGKKAREYFADKEKK